MNELHEEKYIGDVLHWEEDAYFSREVVDVKQEDLPIGSLLSQVAETGQWVPLKLNASDGSEQAKAIVIGATKKESKYLIIARHAIAKEAGIVWPQTKSETIDVVKQQLEARGILVRL